MNWIDDRLRDLRYAVRQLAAAPLFTLTAVLTLGLGIGANTAIFSLVDAALLRSLPVSHPEQLVNLTDPTATGEGYGTSSGVRGRLGYSEYVGLRDGNQVFSGLLASQSEVADLPVASYRGAPQTTRVQLVSGNFFQVLGVPAWRGRTLTPADDQPGAAPVAVMSYGYWSSHYGGDASIVGRPLRALGTVFTVVGVAPPGFFGDMVGDAPALWFPLNDQPAMIPGSDMLHDPPGVSRYQWLYAAGRLRPGVTLAQAQANVDVVFKPLVATQADQTADPVEHRSLLNQQLKLSRGATGASDLDDYTHPLWALLGLVGIVLLMTLANLAGMLMARAAARQREIGARIALGAARSRLLAQLLTESLLLAFLGGALGCALALAGERILLRLASSGGTPIALDLHPDLRLLGFLLGLCALSGLLIGVLPALRLSRLDVNAGLQAQQRGAARASRRGGRAFSLGKIFVAAQVALSLALLAGAGLFVHTMQKLAQAPLGFTAQRVMVFDLDAGSAGYAQGSAIPFLFRVRDRLAALPDAQAVSFSDNGLFSGSDSNTQVKVEGYLPTNGKRTSARFDEVAPEYFSTFGIPLVAGRAFGESDTAAAPHVCMVNRTFANTFLAGRNALGIHVTDLYPDDHGATCVIVGVVRDVKHGRITEKPVPRFYLPFAQPLPSDVPDGATFAIRVNGAGGDLAAGIASLLRELAPALAAPRVQPLQSLVDDSIATQRIMARLAGFFGLLALALAAVGMYGVMAYGVERRTQEIGIRTALGAQPGRVVAMVVGETAVLVAVGLAAGIPASLLLGHTVASLLYGISPRDPAALAAAAFALSAVALLAALVPAVRGSRIDPLHALRQE